MSETLTWVVVASAPGWIEAMEPERFFSFRWHPYAVEPGVDYSTEPTTLVAFTLEEYIRGGGDPFLVEEYFRNMLKALLAALLAYYTFFRRGPNLPTDADVLFVAFVLIPWKIFGSAYADMRLVPYFMAVTLLAIRVGPICDSAPQLS